MGRPDCRIYSRNISFLFLTARTVAGELIEALSFPLGHARKKKEKNKNKENDSVSERLDLRTKMGELLVDLYKQNQLHHPEYNLDY